jgi:hypothetical protein
MSRRGIARRLEGLEGRLGTGGRWLKAEFYKQARDGTLIRLPNSDDGKAERTIRVVFVGADRDGGGGPTVGGLPPGPEGG